MVTLNWVSLFSYNCWPDLKTHNDHSMQPLLKIHFLVLITVSFLSAQERGGVPLRSTKYVETTTRALVVGISDYQNNGVIQDLRFADRDALEFVKFLRSKSGGSVNEEQIRLLTNEQATGAQVNAALDWLKTETQPGDRVVIYFAGHGAAEKIYENGFLLCYDSPYNFYSTGNISTLDLEYKVRSLIEISKARVHLIVDACRAGKLSGGGSTHDKLAHQIGSEIRILSCQSDEFSMEGPQWGGGRGAFSYHLIRGLYGLADQDSDQEVALYEVERYVQDRLREDLLTTRQFPKAYGDYKEVLSISDDSVLLSLKKQNGISAEEFQVSVGRSFEDAVLAEINDSVIQRTYIRFKQSLGEKRFLEPEGDCAEYYFSILLKDPRLKSLHGHIARVYSASLQDESQRTMNRFLDSEVRELTKMKRDKLDQYKNYPAWIQRAAELIDPADPWHRRLKSRQYLFEGMMLYLTHLNTAKPDSMETVVRKLHQSIQLQKENPLGYFFLSNLYAVTKVKGRKNWDSCYHYAALAVSHAPNWVLPFAYLIHNTCNYFKDRDIPSGWIDRAWELDSTNVFLLKSLGDCQFYGKSYEEAISYYNRALELDSTDATLYTNLGASYQSLKIVEQAELYYLKSIQVNQRQTVAYYSLGFLYYTLDRLQEAEENYRIAEQNGMDRPELFGRQALLYLDLGKWKRVEEKCIQLEQRDPNDWRPWYYRACLAAARSQNKDALKYLEKALELGGPKRNEIDQQKHLKSLRETGDFQKLMEKYKK